MPVWPKLPPSGFKVMVYCPPHEVCFGHKYLHYKQVNSAWGGVLTFAFNTYKSHISANSYLTHLPSFPFKPSVFGSKYGSWQEKPFFHWLWIFVSDDNKWIKKLIFVDFGESSLNLFFILQLMENMEAFHFCHKGN